MKDKNQFGVKENKLMNIKVNNLLSAWPEFNVELDIQNSTFIHAVDGRF